MPGRQVNKAQLSEIFGVTQATLTTWQKRGLPIQSEGGPGQSHVYDTKDVIRWFVNFEIDRKFGHAEHVTEALNKDYEQARLAKAQADGKEIENQIKRGELAPVELMTRVLAQVASQITAVLDSIPQKIKRNVPKLTASDIDIIKREIVKTQNAAANIDINIEQLVEDFKRSKGGASHTGEADPAEAE